MFVWEWQQLADKTDDVWWRTLTKAELLLLVTSFPGLGRKREERTRVAGPRVHRMHLVSGDFPIRGASEGRGGSGRFFTGSRGTMMLYCG